MKVLGALICGCISLTIPLGIANVAHAAPRDGHGRSSLQVDQKVNWQRRDTATYVVSTLNLLRTDGGALLTKMAENRMGVERYAVYADDTTRGLYFIQLKRNSESIVGVLAYRMGWPKPLSLSPKLDGLGIVAASRDIQQAYRNDSLTFLGSFTTSLPR